MSSTWNTLKDYPEIQARLERALTLLGWDAIPEVSPDEPTFPTLASFFAMMIEKDVQLHGEDWPRQNQATVRGSWGAFLASY